MTKFQRELEIQGRAIALDAERMPLLDALNEHSLCGIGVEVGVENGLFSDSILSYSQLTRLISVDVWRDEVIMAGCARLLAKHGTRSVMLRTDSVVASTLFADGSLDFVYLDTFHDTWHITRDIAAWYPKVRQGGLFAGHDYVPGYWCPLTGRFFEYGVIEAVDTLVSRHGLELFTTGYTKSWWVWKAE